MDNYELDVALCEHGHNHHDDRHDHHDDVPCAHDHHDDGHDHVHDHHDVVPCEHDHNNDGQHGGDAHVTPPVGCGCCDNDSVLNSGEEIAALPKPVADVCVHEERIELLGAPENCGCGDCCDNDSESGCTEEHMSDVTGECCCGLPGEREEKSTTFRIQNMCCEQEAVLIRKLLAGQTGVSKVSVSAIGRLAVVDHCRWDCCASPRALVTRLNVAKLGASIRDSGVAYSVPFSVETRSRIELAVVWVLLATSLLLLAPRDDGTTEAAEWISLVGTVLGGARVMWTGAIQLRYRSLGIHVLLSIAIVGTVVLGALGDREAWLDGAVLVAVFLAVEQLEAWGMHQVARALNDVGAATVSETALLSTGETVAIDAIKPGDVLAVRAGDQVPVDGVVARGAGAIDESVVTGESVPLHKEMGSAVLGGTMCQQGYLEVRAETAGSGTMLAKIVALLERAQGEKTRSQTVIENFVKLYTPVVLLVALVYGVVCSEITGSGGDCARTALVILILACPCALVAAAPSPVAFGVAAAVRSGAVIKSPQAFEDLASSRTVVFDKTGTLTEGNFEVVATCWPGGVGETAEGRQRLWDTVCAVQARSTHPIAAALVRHVTGCAADAYDAVMDGAAEFEVEAFRAIPGVGVECTVSLPGSEESVRVTVGSRKAVTLAGATLSPAGEAQLAGFDRQAEGCTVVFVILDGVVEMATALSDVIRAGSHGAVAELQRRRIETVMLTGDRDESAKRVCAEVGIAEYQSGLKPEDKLAWVQRRVAAGTKVLMIGDGMNDGPSLAAATVGVAMGAGGTAMAVDSAGVVLIRDDIGTIPALITLSKRCRWRIRQNIALAVSIKLVFIGLAITRVFAKLWVAVLVDAMAVLFVLANSYRGMHNLGSPDMVTPVILSAEAEGSRLADNATPPMAATVGVAGAPQPRRESSFNTSMV